MDHIDNQSECAGNSTKALINVAGAMSVIRQIRFILLNPVTPLINIFQDFVDIVYDRGVLARVETMATRCGPLE